MASLTTSEKAHPFPDEMVSPDQKLSYDYGLKAAKAIFHNTINYGPSLFYNNRKEYWELTEYAQGEQSQDKYKPLLKINPKAQGNRTWVGALRWGIKNYATKRINIVTSKVSERKYSPVVDAIDLGSINQKKEYEARLQAFMDNRELSEAVGQLVGENFAPEDIDPRLIPTTTDEKEIWMNTNYKDRHASYMEKLMQHHIERLKYDNMKRLMAFDQFVYGVQSAFIGMDYNVLPEMYHVPPLDVIVPPSKREDFSDIKYAGHVMRPTIDEFKMMVGSEFNRDELTQIIDEQSKTATTGFRYTHSDYHLYAYNDVPRMEVMRFAFKSTDELVNVSKPDTYGNTRLLPKKYHEYQGKGGMESFRKKYNGERKLYRTPVVTVYEGFWIVGTDYVFRYKRRSYQERHRGKFAEAVLPFKMFAPNMKNNKVVSTMKQMIPTLDELQSYHIKKQHVIANALPQVWSIDLNALRNAQFKWNDATMSDQDKVEFLFQTGVFLFDSGDRFLPGNNYQPIREMKTNYAQDVMAYVQLIQHALEELDEIIGFNRVTSAGTLRADTLKGTAEIQQQQTEVSLDYLYKADQDVTLELYKSLGVMTLQSVKYRRDGYYERIIGDRAIKELREATNKDYGYKIEPHPTAAQWQQLYQEALEALKMGQIGFDDYLDLQSIQNLKEARMIFKVRVRKNRNEAAQAEQQKLQATLEGQRMSNVQAHENQSALEEKKGENKMKEFEALNTLEQRKHVNKLRELGLTQKLQAGQNREDNIIELMKYLIDQNQNKANENKK
jgi:hypothetical protein